MVMNDGIRALLRDRRFQQVISMIEIGSKDGMNTFDESVSNLYAAGIIPGTRRCSTRGTPPAS